MPVLDHASRDALVATFRSRLYERCGFIEFPPQADWRLASEGWSLTDEPAKRGDKYVALKIPREDDPAAARIVTRKIVPREGGIAHHLVFLAGYKSGKSACTGNWAGGFAPLPGAKVQLVGLEYKTAEHEWNYLCEALFSARGMNMKRNRFYNDVRGGRMFVEVDRGATFEVKSWERKEGLKGAKVTCYIFCESYQFPGLECYTSVSQNLRQMKGFAVFPTTADRPWVMHLHDMAHGRDPDWHCTCGVDSSSNPISFDLKAIMRDVPDWSMLPPALVAAAQRAKLEPRGLMTKERFEIAWLGKLGSFVGRVYEFQRGQRQFTRGTHPHLWKPDGTGETMVSA